MIFPQHMQYSLHTISGTLRHWALAASTAHANAVDDISLLGLVT
jgi:hypothetical protein